MKTNDLFVSRVKEYFGKDASKFLELANKPCTQGFFLNTRKASKQDLLASIDFEYQPSDLTSDSYYHHEENIGKTKAYELGLLYPQEIAASLTSKYIPIKDIHVVVDMCAAPGGKTINIINRLPKEVLCISNDVNYKRALTLSSNIERMGFDNVIITNKDMEMLARDCQDYADCVILDAPCSGEGMIRKYPEILDDYSIHNIVTLSNIQKELLEAAYRILKKGGVLIYSTCTFALEEDEDQIEPFLNRHIDMHLFDLGNEYSSQLKGTCKLSFLNQTEGQFMAVMIKEGERSINKKKTLKPIKEKLIDNFIKENINLEQYYLYKHNDHYYLSLSELPDLGNNVMKYGIYVGDIINKRFEPSHQLYRTDALDFRYKVDLNEEEYHQYIQGNEIKVNQEDHYVQVTYKGYPLGFGKVSNHRLKNKYPKGLRRMI